MQVDWLDFLDSSLHIEQELVNAGLEIALVWGEAHVFASIKLDLGDDRVFLALNIHLVQNELSGLLVDADLCLNDSVVNQPNEGSQALVIVAG